MNQDDIIAEWKKQIVRRDAAEGEPIFALPMDAVVEVLEPRRVRPMRGQVVVREDTPAPSAALWTPDPAARQVKTHRGVVLALGPPARVTEHPDSPEVPYGFQVGDTVQFHFGAVGTQDARTRPWLDGKPATWLCQAEIDAVWEEDSPLLTDHTILCIVAGGDDPCDCAELGT